MRFTLIDKIVELQPGARITALKGLSLAEEYLSDHFPLFPVMPGVLMLESLSQCGAWLIRVSEDFAHSVVILEEARNVKYADFVQPGETLALVAELDKQDQHRTWLKCQGTVGQRVAVRGRLVLRRYNLAEQDPAHAEIDHYLRRRMREQLQLLCQP